MKLVDSVRGTMLRVIREEVDLQLLSIGFQYKEGSVGGLVLEGYIRVNNEIARVVIIDNHRLYIEVWSYDENKWGVRRSYEFTEDTSLFGLVQDAIQKENR